MSRSTSTSTHLRDLALGTRQCMLLEKVGDVVGHGSGVKAARTRLNDVLEKRAVGVRQSLLDGCVGFGGGACVHCVYMVYARAFAKNGRRRDEGQSATKTRGKTCRQPTLPRIRKLHEKFLRGRVCGRSVSLVSKVCVFRQSKDVGRAHGGAETTCPPRPHTRKVLLEESPGEVLALLAAGRHRHERVHAVLHLHVVSERPVEHLALWYCVVLETIACRVSRFCMGIPGAELQSLRVW